MAMDGDKMKKILTRQDLNAMRNDIVHWAHKWNFTSELYIFYMLGKEYIGDEKLPAGDLQPKDVCEGYGPSFIFGMAIDGEVYECLHVMNVTYEEPCEEFRKILSKYGLEMDFVDSTHITTYLEDDETIVDLISDIE